jgi:hypothetical protein
VSASVADAPSAGLSRFVPITAWLPQYNRGWPRWDVVAGLTVWAGRRRRVCDRDGFAQHARLELTA